MKLLEILNMMDIKQHQQVWSISFLIRKQTRSGVSVNEKIAGKLHEPVIKKSKDKESV